MGGRWLFLQAARGATSAEFATLFLLFLVLTAALWRLHLALWKRIDDRIGRAIERIKAEVPPLLHVEEQVAREMEEFRGRLDEVEAINMNVQRQLELLRRRRDRHGDEQ